MKVDTKNIVYVIDKTNKGLVWISKKKEDLEHIEKKFIKEHGHYEKLYRTKKGNFILRVYAAPDDVGNGYDTYFVIDPVEAFEWMIKCNINIPKELAKEYQDVILKCQA